MKAAVIEESSAATMEAIVNVHPIHKVIVDKYIERGNVIDIGPFADKGPGLAGAAALSLRNRRLRLACAIRKIFFLR